VFRSHRSPWLGGVVRRRVCAGGIVSVIVSVVKLSQTELSIRRQRAWEAGASRKRASPFQNAPAYGLLSSSMICIAELVSSCT
jgi:hypothetical protein